MTAVASLTMPRRLPRGCIEDRDRHGNVRIYFRANRRLQPGRIQDDETGQEMLGLFMNSGGFRLFIEPPRSKKHVIWREKRGR